MLFPESFAVCGSETNSTFTKHIVTLRFLFIYCSIYCLLFILFLFYSYFIFSVYFFIFIVFYFIFIFV